MIAASYYGFSVRINSSCRPCSTKLCDVAVSFRIMLKWNITSYDFLGGSLASRITYQLPEFKGPCYRHCNLFTWHTASRTDINHKVRSLELTDLMYGNWNEAHEFCMSRGLHLATLTGNLSERLKVTADLNFSVYGWKQPYVFAGLHRHNLVGNYMISM